MKVLMMLDYIYYCLYHVLKKVPGETMPFDATAIFIGGSLTVHGAILLAVLKNILEINISGSVAKIIIVLFGITVLALSANYYIRKKNGERIIKQYAGRIGGEKTVFIGYCIFFEMLLIPFIAGALMVCFFGEW